jgi:hypothetical protein
MRYIKIFEEFINESIRAEDAYRDLNAVQTVIDNKRDLGFITLIGSTLPSEQFWEMIDDNNLKTMKVKGNDYQAYIYYRSSAEKKAKELRDIAQKYGGYLAWDASKEDSRRIGELLGYDKKDIDAYISKNYKDK